MAAEIERKFLVEKLPIEIHQVEATPIEQYYLSFEPEVRARKKGSQYFLTIKGQGGLVRQEVEISISADDFDALKDMAVGQIVKKRYRIPEQELVYELDIFKSIPGFMIVEVEFHSELEAAAFHQPSWFGEEVTDHTGYQNKNLARFGLPQDK